MLSSATATATPQQDAAFWKALESVGMPRSSFDLPDVALENAHVVCVQSWAGVPVSQTVAEIDKAEEGFDAIVSKAFVNIAISVYCPGVGAKLSVAQERTA